MKELIDKLTHFKILVNNYQEDASLTFDTMEVKLLQDLVNALTRAIVGKHEDWEVSYLELANVRGCCCPYLYPALTLLVSEEIQSFCDSALSLRKGLVKNALDFIHDVKAVKDLSHLNMNSYNPQLLNPFLEQLFKCSNVMHLIKSTSFNQLFSAIKASHIFSETDLRVWSINNLKPNEQLFKGMLEAHKSILQKRNQAVTINVDPLIIERFRRRMLYKEVRSESTVSTSQEEPQNSESFQMENLVCDLQSTVIHRKPLK